MWTPAARTLALRRYAGVTDTAAVLASILVEAGLSAISGVIVFVISLAWVSGVNAPLLPLVGFALLLALALHPRVFPALAKKLLKPFGAETIEPVPFSETVFLLLFYCGTWLIAGTAMYLMLRSLGTDVGLATIPFLGGVSAVGAIVAVLAVFAPSGLGAREASMYGLLLAVTTAGPALGVTLLNRLAITLVELLLFGAGVLSWRLTRAARALVVTIVELDAAGGRGASRRAGATAPRRARVEHGARARLAADARARPGGVPPYGAAPRPGRARTAGRARRRHARRGGAPRAREAENGRHRAEIQRLVVSASRRGTGIGRALLEAAVERARALSLKLLWLMTHEETSADQIYQRLGWTRLGVDPRLLDTPRRLAHRQRLLLPQAQLNPVRVAFGEAPEGASPNIRFG